jgi:hypothetical protein
MIACMRPLTPNGSGADGSWSGGVCGANKCVSHDVPNSNSTGDLKLEGTTGEAREVGCNFGYSGGGSFICEATGDWAGLSCNPMPCGNMAVQFSSYGVIELDGKTGDTNRVTCDLGYSGGGTWYCTAPTAVGDPTWVGPACAPEDCTDTTSARSTTGLAGGVVGSNTAVAVTCAPGFAGGGAWKCDAPSSANGTPIWRGPLCDPKPCSGVRIPHSVYDSSDAQAGFSKGVTGSEVTVPCDPGYGPGGNWTCEVISNGDGNVAWVGPNCSALACADEAVHHSNHVGTNLVKGGVTGSQAKVSCDLGYSPTASVWVCKAPVTSSGTPSWAGDACRAKACADTSVAQSTSHGNSSMALVGVTGDLDTMVCAEGFSGGGEWTWCVCAHTV